MSGGIDTQNGVSVVAMAGDHCVAIAADRRLGAQMQTVSTNFKKIFQINDYIHVGMSGLATDIDTVYEKLRYDVNLLELREERQLEPIRFMSLVRSLLYEHRFGPYFVSPVIAGLDPATNEPYLATSDSIGAFNQPKDFAVAGTSEESLYGICESMWRPGLNPDELFDVISQCLIAAVERDGLSGWGAVVHIITPESVVVKEIKTRMD
ncbi:Proteasome subunit beta type-3 [Tritrichomonas foetus]|uniref:Proteasome subunit beta n=1 Tax=Tritrichomonas foetus TaxID=1144522 RepID=A0A075KKH6_9EUKA|nr:20S proteasome subunit beta 3 [Tritrichomonas foetus]OHS96934.1 Proteasome subunit beta type-3 [Tritrichomonas foetus]|eukprot:OHS96934.1 Proteasome subunit beta type-3 [Tritrichomonas foetus]